MILLILLICVAAAVLLSQLLIDRFGFTNLTYSLAFDADEVTEGETVTLTETICSSKLLPLPWVKAELTTHSALELAADQSAVSGETRFVSSYFCLFPYRRIARKWQVRCTKRGIFTVSHAVIVLNDLFASAEQSRAYPEAFAQITVLPATVDTPQIREFPDQLTGDVLRRRTLIPDRFAFCGIRQYADGDPVRDICWSASARAGEPMVRQFQETSTPSLTVLLRMETRETDIAQVSDLALHEDAIRLSASYLARCAEARIPVRFLANTEINGLPAETAFASGADEKLRLLRMLAAMEGTVAYPFRRLLRRMMAEDSAASILVIVSRAEEDLLRLAAREPRMTVVSLKPLPLHTHLENVQYAALHNKEETA